MVRLVLLKIKVSVTTQYTNFLSNHTCPQLSCLKNILDLTKHTYTVNTLANGYGVSFIAIYSKKDISIPKLSLVIPV